MNETMKMVQSLGLYILTAKIAGKTIDDCRAVSDYQEFLRPYEAQASGMSIGFGFNAENPLKPIDDITLDFNEFCSIAEQIFENGITQMNALSLPFPAVPSPDVAHAAATYFQNYLGTLGNDPRTPMDVESIMGRINELLMRRPATDQRTTGLVVGRVQSGKTRNYVGLMLKAIDEGWNVIIVLTSCSTALADQTEGRILDDFTKSGMVEGPDFTKLNFRVNQTVTSPSALGRADYVYLGVAMKQRDNLDRILGWLNDNSKYVPHMHILLVDDEADNATPDSNQGKKNTLDDDDIDALVDEIKRTERAGGGDFGELAGWVDLVREDGDFSDDDGSPDAVIVNQLKKNLPKATKLADILNNADYRRILYLDPYEVKGVLVDVCNDIRDYFNGMGKRSPKYFIKLLNTLLEVVVERSAINRRICAILAKDPDSGAYNYSFGKFAYVAYTATPYANILNERSDQSPLYPGFIKSLQTSPQYFGFTKIFGEDYSNATPNMIIVCDILECTEDGGTASELRFILRPIQQINDVNISPRQVLDITGPDASLHVKCANPKFDSDWNTFIHAIEWLFCTAAARRWYRRSVLEPKVNARADLSAEEKQRKLNDLEVRWTTMMVNISEKKGIHTNLKKYVDDYLAKVCSVAERDAFVARCKQRWENMTATFTAANFTALFNTGHGGEAYGDFAEYPDWNNILPDLDYFIKGFSDVTVHPVIINSEKESKSREMQDKYSQRKDKSNHWDYRNSLTGEHAWIIIGGNTIGRGLTLAGLTVSYFDRMRDSAAVDTLTQMGRWFGYRVGYELLPRIWMTTESVIEMKKMCITENHMHDVMRENFDAGYSPSDPEHYQSVYYWGRKLSGRQRNLMLGGEGVGTTATTDDISSTPDDIHAIYDASRTFIGGRGAPTIRSNDDYQYWEMPLWRNVSRIDVLNYLDGIKDRYPQNSQRKIKCLIDEIVASEILHFDVVIGEPVKSGGGKPYFVAGNISARDGLAAGNVKSGKPKPTEIGNVLHYTKVRSDMAFYSMIRKIDINRADYRALDAGKKGVLAEIRLRMKDNGGHLPAQFEAAFEAAGANGADVEQRLNAYIAYCGNHPEFVAAACIRGCLPEGIRNRSSVEYCELVHEVAGHETPVLQLYFVTPPDSMPQDEPPVSISFYWPKHDPGIFQIGTVLPPPPPPHPTRGQIWTAIGEILRNNNFPMTTHPLKDALMLRFPNEIDAIYWGNVVDGQEAGGYRKFPGKKAYYSLAWVGGEDPVAKVNQELLICVEEVLKRDHARHTSAELVEQVERENTRFEGVADFNTTILNNKLLTDENMALYGIRKVCGSPVIYQAD